MENLPLPLHLMKALGYPKGSPTGCTVLIRPGQMLKAVGNTHIPVNDDIEGEELALDVRARGEELLKKGAYGLCSYILKGGHEGIAHGVLVEEGHRLVSGGCVEDLVLDC